MDEDKSILVVEDDNMLRNIIMSQLIPRYKVIGARDGEEALTQIEAHHPKLIILDLLLPKLGGFGVLERLRSMEDQALAQTPVLIVSNMNDAASRARATQYNVLDYFGKTDITLGHIVAIADKVFGQA